MKKLKLYFRIFSGVIGFSLLFLLIFLYIFLSLGLLSAGLIIFPCALLGITGMLHIITDIGLPVMALLGLGTTMLGGGMCLGAAIICPASVKRLQSFIKGTEWQKRRLYDEEG